MSKKTNLRIGIPGWSTGENSYGAGKSYLEFASNFGRAVIVTPEMVPEDNIVDILLLPGGPDLNPRAYGQTPGFFTGNADVFKEYFYSEMLGKYIEAGIPCFGVCLGMQALAVHFGSTLTQNLLYHPHSKARWEAGHEVYPLHYNHTSGELHIQKTYGFEVNSHHHQGVYLNQLGQSLIPTNVYPEVEKMGQNTLETCVVESFVHQDLPIVGIQWHPEEWYDSYAMKMFELLCSYYTENANNEGEKVPFSAFVQQGLQPVS